MSLPALEASGLEKRFGAVAALAGVDFTVAAGSALAVLGPNGAGKTTLLRLLAGLAQPTAGRLRIGDGGQSRRERRARVGFVGHATGLYDTLTVRENLLFAARLHAVPNAERRAGALLEHLNLADVAERPASSCSRGMAQRLSIARGLVHEPAIVLLDEPFTGLDRTSSERVVALLAGLRNAGRTLIVATHDLRRAAEVADAALVLRRGRVIHRAEGAPLSAEALERGFAQAAGAPA